MKRILLIVKRFLGFRMLYGEIAEINGAGPCQRCVGRSVSGPTVQEDMQQSH